MHGHLVDAHRALDTTGIENTLRRVALVQASDEAGTVARVLAGDPELWGAMTPDGQSEQGLAVAQIIAALQADWPAFEARARQAIPPDAVVVDGLGKPPDPRPEAQTHAVTQFNPLDEGGSAS